MEEFIFWFLEKFLKFDHVSLLQTKVLKLSSLLVVSIFIKSKNKIQILRISMMDKDYFLYQSEREGFFFACIRQKCVAVRILFFEGSRTFVAEEEQKIRSKIKLCLLWFWSNDKSVLWRKWRRRDFYPPKNRSHGIFQRTVSCYVWISGCGSRNLMKILANSFDKTEHLHFNISQERKRRRTMLY